MSIESTLNGVLENAGFTVYGVRAPDATAFPYLVFSKVSPGRVYSHDGYSQISRPRYQIDAYARTYNGAKTMAAAVIEAIEENLPGSMLAGEIDDELDGTYRTIIDYFINYKEDVL